MGEKGCGKTKIIKRLSKFSLPYKNQFLENQNMTQCANKAENKNFGKNYSYKNKIENEENVGEIDDDDDFGFLDKEKYIFYGMMDYKKENKKDKDQQYLNIKDSTDGEKINESMNNINETSYKNDDDADENMCKTKLNSENYDHERGENQQRKDYGEADEKDYDSEDVISNDSDSSEEETFGEHNIYCDYVTWVTKFSNGG